MRIRKAQDLVSLVLRLQSNPEPTFPSSLTASVDKLTVGDSDKEKHVILDRLTKGRRWIVPYMHACEFQSELE